MNLRTFLKSVAFAILTPWQLILSGEKSILQGWLPLRKVNVTNPSEIHKGMIVRSPGDRFNYKFVAIIERSGVTGELYEGAPLHNEWQNKFFVRVLSVDPRIKFKIGDQVLICLDPVMDHCIEFYA